MADDETIDRLYRAVSDLIDGTYEFDDEGDDRDDEANDELDF